jgi:alpha-galactosidase
MALSNNRKNFIVATLSAIAVNVNALDNGLGLVPQMGWNTWNKFACNIDEPLIKQSADQLIEYGL